MRPIKRHFRSKDGDQPLRMGYILQLEKSGGEAAATRRIICYKQTPTQIEKQIFNQRLL